MYIVQRNTPQKFQTKHSDVLHGTTANISVCKDPGKVQIVYSHLQRYFCCIEIAKLLFCLCRQTTLNTEIEKGCYVFVTTHNVKYGLV